MAITLAELKNFLNVDSDNTAHDGTLTDLIAAAKEELFVATGKSIDDDNPLVKQYIKLYSRREFDMLTDSIVDSRLLDLQKKILLSARFEEAASSA